MLEECRDTVPRPAPESAIDDHNLTRDAFLGGRLHLFQPRRGYRAGIDAVLLAAAVRPKDDRAGARLIDLGAGVGTVGLCAASRLPGLDVTLLERDANFATLAARNIALNELEDRARVHCLSIGAPASDLDAVGIAAGSYDIAVANPPYRLAGTGTESPHPLKADAHAMQATLTMLDWMRFMARLLRPGGTAYLVHLPEAVPQILAACERRFGALEVCPLYPREHHAAHRILLRAVKGSRAGLRLGCGIVLHEPGSNAFRPPVARALREGTALEAFS